MSSAKKPKQHAQQQKRSKPNIFDKILEPPFEDYWLREEVDKGLKRKQLIQGVLRISQRNYENAYVDDPEGGPDYALIGTLARNRALQDDVVVIQVLPRTEWLHDEQGSDHISDPTKLGAASLETDAPKSTAVVEHDPTPPGGRVEQAPCKTLIDALYSDVESAKPTKPDESGVLGYQKTAKVVYIVERGHSRVCAGYLKAFDQGKQLALLSPRDTKLPRVLLPLSDCPSDYCKSPKKYEATVFICRISEWMTNVPFPVGSLYRSLGEAGAVRGESNAILMENGIDFAEFSPEALQCLPELPWTIPDEEVLKRRDFRRDCVFTIDPDDAKDLDDALHVKRLDAETFEIGVHIADVSYFVKEGTALDLTAADRATSVYLVQEVIPMLPRLLCEELCSLNPNADRLVFSVVWCLTNQCELVSQWIGRSVIRSCSKMSYAHAQAIIDGSWTEDFLPKITGLHTTTAVPCVVASVLLRL